MNGLGNFHWMRVLAGGFLAEVSVIVIVIPVSRLFGQRTLAYTAVTASLVSCFLFAIWVGRGVRSRVVLHGALVGVVATLLYVGLTRGQPGACFEDPGRYGGRFRCGAPSKGHDCSDIRSEVRTY
jgi:hypothetical protein